MSNQLHQRKNRRQRNRRNKHRLTLIGSICIIVIIAGISCGFAFRSKAERMPQQFKYYTEIRVSSGMTLWDIAEQYKTNEYKSHKDYITEIKDINSMTTDDLYYGQYLTVPYYSAELK